MKSLQQYSKENTGIYLENTKCLDSINKTFSYDRIINKKNNSIVLRDVKLNEDIQLPNKKILKKGTEFVKVELTPTKKVKLYKLSENSVKPFKTLLQHSLNEDMFPVVPAIAPDSYPTSPIVWNDGRVDGPFAPTMSINGVLLNSIACLTKVKEELMNLSVEQVTVLLQGLGNTFEEQVIREVILKYMEMAGHPMRFGLANGV